MISAPVPTGSQGPGGPIYICHPVDPSASPSASVLPSNMPSISIPMGTGVPQSMPTDSQGPRGPMYVCCPADDAGIPGVSPSDSTMTLSGPVPSLTPATTAEYGKWTIFLMVYISILWTMDNLRIYLWLYHIMDRTYNMPLTVHSRIHSTYFQRHIYDLALPSLKQTFEVSSLCILWVVPFCWTPSPKSMARSEACRFPEVDTETERRHRKTALPTKPQRAQSKFWKIVAHGLGRSRRWID